MYTPNKVFLATWAVLALSIVAGCDSNDDDPIDNNEPAEVEWNYDNKGPDRWMNLAAEFAICGSGSRQSPIDISLPPQDDIGGFTFAYTLTGLRVHNDSKTIHLLIDSGSSIDLGGVTYALTDIHFHTTSEHTLNGSSFGGEVHFVHENSSGELAYVAALILASEENKAVVSVLAELPSEPGEPIDIIGTVFDPFSFLPEVRTFYRYDGSLTTPPCTEGVKWIVLQNPLSMSAAQLAGMRSRLGLNFRPPQPLNGRTITQN